MSSWWVFGLLLIISNVSAKPKTPKTFWFDGFTKGFTISRVDDTAQTQAQTTNNNAYQVRFVPLISLLAGMFPQILTRLGQFSNVNKVTATRRFPLAEKQQNQENSIAAPPVNPSGNKITEDTNDDDNHVNEEDEDYMEKELIECDGNHLGLWPDITDPQRYYKCEVDPRSTPNSKCIRALIQEKNQNEGKGVQALEKIQVPGVKPCYLLSMLKCANGYKYQHSTRICVPDIVYG